MRDRYQLEAEHLFDNVDDLQILLAPEPYVPNFARVNH